MKRRLWIYPTLFAFLYSSLAHPYSMIDKNGDGRVDMITWSSGGITDQKIDVDFDGRFERWIVHRGQTVMDMTFKKGRLVGLVSERKFGKVAAKIRISNASSFRLELKSAVYSYARGGLSFNPVTDRYDGPQERPNCGDLKHQIDTSAKDLRDAIASKTALNAGVDAKCKFSEDGVNDLGDSINKIDYDCLVEALQKAKVPLIELANISGNNFEGKGASPSSFVLPAQDDFLTGFAFAQARLLGECAGEIKVGCPASKSEPIIKCMSLGKAKAASDRSPAFARMDPIAMTIELNLDRINFDVPRPDIVELVQHEYLHLAMVNLCREEPIRPYCKEEQQELFVKTMLKNIKTSPKCTKVVTVAMPAADAERAQAVAIGGQSSGQIDIMTKRHGAADRVAGLVGAKYGSSIQGRGPGIADGEEAREVAAAPKAPEPTPSSETQVIERPVPKESEFRTIAPSIEQAASKLEGLTFGDTPSQLVVDTTKRAATEVMDKVDRAWDSMSSYIKSEVIPVADASEVKPVRRADRSEQRRGPKPEKSQETAAASSAKTTDSRERNFNDPSDQGGVTDFTVNTAEGSSKTVKAQVAQIKGSSDDLATRVATGTNEQFKSARENVNEGLKAQAESGKGPLVQVAQSEQRRDQAPSASSAGATASQTSSAGAPASSGRSAASASSNASSPRRQPAAVSPTVLIDTLASGRRDEVKSVSVQMLRQNLSDPQFVNQLKTRGVAIVDTNKKSYGAPYREAKRKYLIRSDETITIMGSSR